MTTLQEPPPSFYVLYSDDFATKLSVPTPVVKEHRDFLCQIIVNLTTESGRFWDVEIEKINGDYYFTDGWSEFVKDRNLVEGKLLLFRIVSDTTFHVSIFGHHCWSEVEPPSYQMVVASTWRFVKMVENHHISQRRMDIPKRFAEGTGIATSGKMRLKTEDGSEWSIYITDGNAHMYSMTRGWAGFVKGNKLQKGTVLLFEFVPDSDNVVKVRALEKKAGEKLLLKASRGGLLN